MDRLPPSATPTAAGTDPAAIGTDPTAVGTPPPASMDATHLAPDSRPRAATKHLERGDNVGRYVVLEPVGAGGMGVVYAAYDPELDRRVALKLLRVNPDGSRGDDESAARLQREAQAMARLNHPNVITVHDVGAIEEGVFIAMEFVGGGTLGTWLRETERTRAEIIAALGAAGRGLAAAHAADLVHRDFKPDNVLMGVDGRVRVSDFGLARESEAPTIRAAPPTAPQSAVLTQTGALMGTPAYMSPEQHAGQVADDKSDQFSFCVVAYEALAGRRPWQSETATGLAIAVMDSPAPELPASVPTHLRRAISRGLARKAADRFGSMDELLAEFARDPAARRRRWLAVGGGTVLVGALVGAVAVSGQGSVCTGAQAQLAEVWGPSHEKTVADAIRGTGVGFAETTLQRVTTDLDTYARDWESAFTDACEATRVRGEQSEALMDLRVSCLDRRRVAMNALIQVLGAADAEVVANASRAVASLPSIARCSDREALLAAVPPPEDPAVVRAVADARAKLATSDSLRVAGQYDDAARIATEVVAELEGVDYPAVRAEAEFALGRALGEQGDYAGEAARARAAVNLALASGSDVLAAEVAASLVYTVGYRLDNREQSELWAEQADALTQRTGSDPTQRSRVIGNRGVVLFGSGDVPGAAELLEQALVLRIEGLGEDHIDVLSLRGNLASARGVLAEFDAAFAQHEEVVAKTRLALGDDHPEYATRLANYGGVLVSAGKEDQALDMLLDALRIKENALGPDHPDLDSVLSNLGVLYFHREQWDPAEEYFRRALDLARKYDDTTSVSTGLGHLANIASARGDKAQATKLYLEALELQQKTLGDHRFVAITLYNLAGLSYQARNWDDVIKWATQSVTVFEKSVGPDHPIVHGPLFDLGVALRETGDVARSVAALERGLKIADEHHDAKTRGDTAMELARSLWAQPGDRDRAREMAGAAAALLDEANANESAEEARAWLSAHGG